MQVEIVDSRGVSQVGLEAAYGYICRRSVRHTNDFGDDSDSEQSRHRRGSRLTYGEAKNQVEIIKLK